MNIFGITGQYLELLQMAEDETLDQHMINDTLEGVDWEFEEKADAYAKVINSLEGNVAAIDKEIERLSKHKKRISNENMFCGAWLACEDGVYAQNDSQIDAVACYHPILPIERMKNLETGEEQIKIAYKRNGIGRAHV